MIGSNPKTIRATTQNVLDSSTLIATDAFVQNVAETAAISTLTVIGHSWTGGPNSSSSYTPQFGSQNMIPRLMGMLGTTQDNLWHMATSASYLTKANAAFGGKNTGWGGVFEYVVPYSNPLIADTATSQIPIPVPNPSAFVIVHGVNDIGMNGTNTTTTLFGLMQTSYQNTLRTVISRCRAGALYCSYYASGATNTAGTPPISWDSTITTSGFTSTAQTAANTGVGVYRSSTNGNTITYTIPANFAGGTIAMCFMANTNAWSLCNTTMNSTDASTVVALTQNSGTPYVAFANGDVIAWYSGGVDSGERGLITAGGGTASITVTRGFNSTTKTTHAISDEIVKASSIGVTFTTSGSNATITGTLALGAKGMVTPNASGFSERIPVIKRFVCTGADAGKTIVATVNAVASDTATVDFDSVWIEAFDPQPCIVASLPVYAYSSNAFVTRAQMIAWNTSNTAVVAEFDGAVQSAEFNTTIFNRGGTLNANILSTDTTFTITAENATTFATLVNNTTFAIEGERILVGTITNNNNGTFTLSNCTRGYDGTTAASHTSGKIFSDGIWFGPDCLHPNGYGHNIFANALYNAFKSYQPQSSYSLSTGAGNTSTDMKNPTIGLVNNGYLTVPITNLANASTAFNTQTFIPIYIPTTCIITQMGVVVTTTGATASVCRFGLYDLDQYRRAPGTLYQDFGTVSTIGTGFIAVNTYKLIRPGWYYLSQCEQGSGTQSTKRGFNSSATIQGWAGPVISTTTTPTTAWLPTFGFTQTGVSGGFAVTPTPVEASGASTVIPLIWIKTQVKAWV
jgi:lysophospholipase L1-like esterase